MLLFMGLVSARDVCTKDDITNQMSLDKKIKIILILSSLLTSNVKLLSDPYIPMTELDGKLVSLYENV